MKIAKTSTYSGKENSMEINITQDQIDYWENNKSTLKIQNVFPNLTDDEREFLLTGITSEEWEELNPEYDEDYDYEDDEPAF